MAWPIRIPQTYAMKNPVAHPRGHGSELMGRAGNGQLATYLSKHQTPDISCDGPNKPSDTRVAFP